MIEVNKSFAIAIDYQSHILPPMFEKEKLIETSVKLLKGLVILDVPIYLTQQYTKGLGDTVEEITDAADTKAYTDKLRFSACPDLINIIPKNSERPWAIVCGIEAHVCVLQTLLDLKDAGYLPALVADCTSSRKAFDRDMAIGRARDAGIIITTYEALLFELLKKAGSDSFKAISRLVK